MLVFALSAGAAEIQIPDDAVTLSEAVAAAVNDGDVIVVDGGRAGRLTEAVPLVVERPLTIRGVGASRPVLAGGDATDGLFRIDDGATLVLQDVDLDGDGLHRLARVVDGALTLRWVEAYDHVAGDDGGAIRLESGAEALLVEASALHNGTSGGSGGLVAAFGGTVSLLGSRLGFGTATVHGGLIAATDTTLVIADSILEASGAGQRGGALHVVDAPVPVDVDRSQFLANNAQGERGGGAIYAEDAPLTLTDTWFERNVAEGTEGGGAVYLRNDAHSATRTVFCGNTASADGGAVRVHDATFVANNLLLHANTAQSEGGAVYVKGKASTVTLGHATASENLGGPTGAPTPGQAAWTEGALQVVDAYIADHTGDVALYGQAADDLIVSTTAFWNNTGGDADPVVPNAVLDDPGIPPPQLPCVPDELVPPAGSPLVGAGTFGSTIGAFGGPERWTDEDGDSTWSWSDCNDDDPSVFSGAPEHPADGVDGDCDLLEDCYADADQDGLGEPDSLVETLGLDCHGPGEAANGDDVCPGFDDALDTDGDEVPDGCDGCPTGAGPDSDGDTVCDEFDQCPGFDDRVDTDGDGVPDGCDPDAPEPTGTTPPTGTPPVDRGGDGAEDGDGIVAIAGCGCGGAGRPSALLAVAAALAATRTRRGRRRVRGPR